MCPFHDLRLPTGGWRSQEQAPGTPPPPSSTLHLRLGWKGSGLGNFLLPQTPQGGESLGPRSQTDGAVPSSTRGLLKVMANSAELPPARCGISIPQHSEGSTGIVPTLQVGFWGTEGKHLAQGPPALRSQSKRSTPGSLTPTSSPTVSILAQATHSPPPTLPWPPYPHSHSDSWGWGVALSGEKPMKYCLSGTFPSQRAYMP